MKPRVYRNNLDFIKSAIRACRDSAKDLVSASKLLIDTGYHAQSLSLSVLALEELGKLFSVDGLLLAQPKDYKSEAFEKSLKSHAAKLTAVQLLPMLIERVATIDSRYEKEPMFKQTIILTISDLKSRASVVLRMLSVSDFHALDKLKQEGFYSHLSGSGFIMPKSAIKPKVASEVYGLAWRASSTFDFILDDERLSNYIEFTSKLRKKMSAADFEFVTKESDKYLLQIFPSINQMSNESS